MKIKEILKINKENNEYLDNLEIEKKDKIKSYVIGYFIGLMIVLSPIIITAHFFIYNFYYELVVLILSLLVVLFFSLGEIFSHRFLIYFSKNSENRSLKITHIIDTLIYFIVCIISCLIIMLL